MIQKYQQFEFKLIIDQDNLWVKRWTDSLKYLLD